MALNHEKKLSSLFIDYQKLLMPYNPITERYIMFKLAWRLNKQTTTKANAIQQSLFKMRYCYICIHCFVFFLFFSIYSFLRSTTLQLQINSKNKNLTKKLVFQDTIENLPFENHLLTIEKSHISSENVCIPVNHKKIKTTW